MWTLRCLRKQSGYSRVIDPLLLDQRARFRTTQISGTAICVIRPLEGEAPTIDVAVGYSKSNSSTILKLFLSRLDELGGANQQH